MCIAQIFKKLGNFELRDPVKLKTKTKVFKFTFYFGSENYQNS